MENKTDTRLWMDALEKIYDRLHAMEQKLTLVSRIDERVQSHELALQRLLLKNESLSGQITQLKLWQAHHGDTAESRGQLTQVIADTAKLKQKQDGRDYLANSLIMLMITFSAGVAIYFSTIGVP